MFRIPVIFLLSTFLSVGPTYFERVHIEEVNRALAAIPIPKVATHSPLKRLPTRPPVHDPATCAICALIHAPAVSQVWLMPSLSPTARVGLVAPESLSTNVPVRISCPQCRGPPIG